VPNDDNRVADGTGLRNVYRHELGYESVEDLHLDNLKPSVLEVVVGLSIRLAFQTSRLADACAWELLKNLEFDRFYDPIGPRKANALRVKLIMLVQRRYYYNGEGGFFPLNDPKEDQRKVEIWYQMAAYINEMNII
jgi:hypothetical protein